MKTSEALATLEQFQAWRTGGENDKAEMPDPRKITQALDAAIALMRLLAKAEAMPKRKVGA